MTCILVVLALGFFVLWPSFTCACRRIPPDSPARSLLVQAINAAEDHRSTSGTYFKVATDCRNSELLNITSFPATVTACRIQQTPNGTYGYVTSSTMDKSYQFDGTFIAQGSAAMPSSMP
ncbi:pilin [Deinococcus hopiensis]|uniref:Type IV pilus assembly protein PilA n=1 Tax=Deinococcus hopiensis KR-140 TaxID=695939 RepID=A0A1W1UR87_9DEIO|nr:pilin [Deinococcus hopiensis]SMB83321.1 type IV pilus assembly protein PilA [Deinococcus hopiensis KR-140]